MLQHVVDGVEQHFAHWSWGDLPQLGWNQVFTWGLPVGQALQKVHKVIPLQLLP
jgi:hypothetical protein